MKIGDAGLAIIREFERGPIGGPALTAYQDGGGVWTIGYGHTQGVKQGDTMTPMEVAVCLVADCQEAEWGVESVINVPVTQNQFDALVSFVFNLGAFRFKNSTLLRMLNAGDYTGASRQFPRWRYDNGKEQAGLVRRRKWEQQLFDTP